MHNCHFVKTMYKNGPITLNISRVLCFLSFLVVAFNGFKTLKPWSINTEYKLLDSAPSVDTNKSIFWVNVWPKYRFFFTLVTTFGCDKIGTQKIKENFFAIEGLFFKGWCTLLHCSHIRSNLKSFETWYFYSWYVHKLTPM